MGHSRHFRLPEATDRANLFLDAMPEILWTATFNAKMGQ